MIEFHDQCVNEFIHSCLVRLTENLVPVFAAFLLFKSIWLNIYIKHRGASVKLITSPRLLVLTWWLADISEVQYYNTLTKNARDCCKHCKSAPVLWQTYWGFEVLPGICRESAAVLNKLVCIKGWFPFYLQRS